MEACYCIDSQWPPDELLVKYQYISDVLIALAYFSIPLELIYFVKKSAFFPYRWVLMQFGAFIILCGATHFINLWTFTMHTKAVAVVMTVAKVACAIVSCATALMLVHIIPDLLSVKTRELFLRNKAEQLDREMGLILTQEETGRHDLGPGGMCVVDAIEDRYESATFPYSKLPNTSWIYCANKSSYRQ